MTRKDKRERAMNSQNRKRRSDLARTMIVCLLTLCMTAGMAALDGPAYGGDFSGSSPFSNTGRSTYYHNGRFSGNVIVNGVDISDWQSKNCDFAKAKKAGVDFAIMKVTGTYYGRTNLSCYNDSNFATLYKKARANGVMVGAYAFSQAKNAAEGKKEAQIAINRLKALGIGPKDLQLPLYMDYEFAGGVFGRMYGLSRSNATAAAVAFCNTVKAAGYTPGIYASTSFYSSYIDKSCLASDVDIWCAQYYSTCQSGMRYSKWQYSSSARINGMLSYLGYQGNIDANFWYINKKVNPKPLTKICGRYTLSLKDAKKPKFKIYRGSTLLKEGTDYTVGYIRNNRKGRAYAYIKGIGRYGGYALVPLKVADASAGSVNKDLTGISANYMTTASTAKSSIKKSSGSSSSSSTSSSKGKFKAGSTYTTQVMLRVRTGPSTSYRWKKRSELTADARKHSQEGTYAVLNKGTKVTCLEVSGNWIRIPSGWICGKEGSEVYIK